MHVRKIFIYKKSKGPLNFVFSKFLHFIQRTIAKTKFLINKKKCLSPQVGKIGFDLIKSKQIEFILSFSFYKNKEGTPFLVQAIQTFFV